MFGEETIVNLQKVSKNLNKMVEDIRDKIFNNEYNTVKLKGVSNLSRADLEMTILYADALVRSGGYGFQGMVEPRGNIRELFEAYKVI